jgi:hypothetical protein
MTVALTEDSLGRLELGPLRPGAGVRECNPFGYVVTGWQIGFPSERPVMRNRALGDGVIDSTRFFGARAVSMNITLDVNKQDPQISIDNLTAYMTPHRRPRLSWQIPGSSQERSLLVRGVDAPVSIAGKQAHVITASFIGINGVMESVSETTLVINPGEDVETGRTYDLTFDRQYPPTAGLGERLVVNEGNEVADWEATIFGPAVNPTLTVNGTDISFNRDGGLTLAAGESVVINTRNRTIFLNDDITESRYDKVNFTEWSWEQVRLQPGHNTIRYEEVTLSGSCTFTWRSAWL